MERYYINFIDWIWYALPRPLQKTRNVQWLWALLYPLRVQHDRLMEWGLQLLGDMRWNGQTLLLEAMLRDKMGSQLIWLESLQFNIEGAFATKIEESIDAVGKKEEPGMFIGAAGAVGGVRGVVHVPLFLQPQEPKLRALIEKYKLSLTNYRIEYFI